MSSALHVGVIAAVSLALAWLRRRPTAAYRRADGWRFVTIKPIHWLLLPLIGAITGLFWYIYLFVGSMRADAAQQMKILLILCLAGTAATLGTWFVLLGTKWAWRGPELWIARPFAQPRCYRLIQLRSITFSDVTSSWTMLFADGAKLVLSAEMGGSHELAREAKWQARLIDAAAVARAFDGARLYDIARSTWDPLRLRDWEGPWGFNAVAARPCVHHLAYAAALYREGSDQETVTAYLCWAEASLRNLTGRPDRERATHAAVLLKACV